MDLGLKDRRAIVTGGSKGIGRAVALELAREGARVAVCSRDGAACAQAAREVEAATGGAIRGWACDVTDERDLPEFFREALAWLGGLDILVNNAGGARPGTFAQLNDEDFRLDLDVKLFAAMRCCRAAFPHLCASGQARVVNVNAVAGRQSFPGLFATVTDRGSCLGFTKALSDEWAPHGILVNSVNVGNVLTPQWERIAQRLRPGASAEQFIDERAKREVPLGRAGRPEEVAAVVAFLSSARASYLTGASVDVAGGLGRYV